MHKKFIIGNWKMYTTAADATRLARAIMDGMSVGVGEECYILPLSSVVESFQVQPGMIKTIGGSKIVLPIIGPLAEKQA